MANAIRRLRRKQQHEWRVIFAYKLTYDQAFTLTFGPKEPGAEEAEVQMTTEMVAEHSRVSCWKCERPFEKVSELPCTGRPELNGGPK